MQSELGLPVCDVYRHGASVLADAVSDLRRELNGLEIIHGRELEREIYEGTLHHGLGHVAQVVARKG